MSEHDPPVICQVLHSLNVGGAEILAREFATRSAGNFTTVFACLDTVGAMGELLRRDGYQVEAFGRRSGVDYRIARRLDSFFRDKNVAIIHAHQYTPFFYSAVSRMPRRRIPILFTEHGRAFPDYRRPKRVWANKLLIGRRDKIVAVGNQVRQALIGNEGIPPQRVQVIYNGVNVSQYRTSASERIAVRQQLGLSDVQIAVFQVARLNPLKDHATAVRTMARLKASHSDIRLYMIGDGEERESVEQMINAAGLQQTVRMLGQRDDVSHLMQAADVGLLTSISEGIPLTIIEAMAAGIPCVATDVGGMSEVIVAGETGLLATARDDTSLAQHLAYLAEHADVRKLMGERGRQRSHDIFSDEKMHDAYHQLYRQMVQN